MNKINISMKINNAFLPNLLITDADGYYNNDCYTSTLASGGYTELLDTNFHLIDILCPIRVSVLIEFY
jgi:hypothetical protein